MVPGTDRSLVPNGSGWHGRQCAAANAVAVTNRGATPDTTSTRSRFRLMHPPALSELEHKRHWLGTHADCRARFSYGALWEPSARDAVGEPRRLRSVGKQAAWSRPRRDEPTLEV